MPHLRKENFAGHTRSLECEFPAQAEMLSLYYYSIQNV